MEVRERKSPRDRRELLSTLMSDFPPQTKDLELHTKDKGRSPLKPSRTSRMKTLNKPISWQHPLKTAFSRESLRQVCMSVFANKIFLCTFKFGNVNLTNI